MNIPIKRKRVVAKNRKHLKYLIRKEVSQYGNNCNLNHVAVFKIKNLNRLFEHSLFNGDISKWNVSNVKYMAYMFKDSQFNGNISNWNVSKVRTMNCMFYYTQFNKNISKWKIKNIITMKNIFHNCIGEKPWWAIEDNYERKIAIDKYELSIKLDNQLTTKEKKFNPKRIKI